MLSKNELNEYKNMFYDKHKKHEIEFLGLTSMSLDRDHALNNLFFLELMTQQSQNSDEEDNDRRDQYVLI